MKKLLSIPMLVTATVMLLSSCKKSSDDNAGGGNSSSNLGAGKAGITLNTSADFAGGTSFSVINTATTTAMTGSSSALRNISLSATGISGVNTRTVMITIICPVDANTTGGSLVGDLSLPNNATILPTITLSSTTGATPGIQYSSGDQSGTLTITKLTSTEIEGTFSGTVKDVNGTATMTVSNGTFAGKF
jgi:hypothetical protein